MKKTFVFVFAGGIMLMAALAVPVQAASSGDALKSAAKAAVQEMTPQAQTVVNEATKLSPGAPQESLLVTRAKEFMTAEINYQTALELANYVITTVNSNSVDAKKIMADAKAALAKIAQEKLAQAQAASAAGK